MSLTALSDFSAFEGHNSGLR